MDLAGRHAFGKGGPPAAAFTSFRARHSNVAFAAAESVITW